IIYNYCICYANITLSLFFLITIGGIMALAIPFSLIWLMEYAKLLTVTEVIEITLSFKFIAIAVIISFGYIWFIRKKQHNKFVNQYSETEKLLHNLAFKSWSTQVSLSNMESHLFKKKVIGIQIKKPVFITALPRAGTTLLLELCVKTNEFSTHTYRDMPFLLTPLFWNRFSRLFKHSGTIQERAHRDGMMINIDSPEAFEEIIWKGFWPSRYKEDRIIPWLEPNYPGFENFLMDHIKKIIFLRKSNNMPRARYISKNNLNIARIAYLKRVFPDSIIVVPFRAPLQHASSLLRQHRNFLKIHEQDSFACKYMNDIGHFDFGNNLRPVDFNNWYSSEQALDSNTLLFWIQYWIRTYGYLLKNEYTHIKFVSFDSLCNDPKKYLEQLGKIIKLKNIETFINNADLIITPKQYSENNTGLPSEIVNEAIILYKGLQRSSLQ
ncbi:sulfotransferase, partial [Candidatus Neomarinimicrobiota bacterium]